MSAVYKYGARKMKYKAVVIGMLCLACLPSTGSPAAKSGKIPTNAASNLGVIGQGSYITQPDPKRPGKFLWKLWAREFIVKSPENSVSGSLIDISATLFSNGVPSATMTAARAEGDNVHNTIIATGGILIKSLVEPGTKLQADKIIWYARENKILATGHVFYKNGKSGMTIKCPAIVADTVLKSIRSSNSGQVVLPRRF
jgi:hypothetical protein